MRRRLLAVAATVAVMLAAPATAWGFSWGTMCTTGALQACGSVSVTFDYNPTTEMTTVRIGITNPQGADGVAVTPGSEFGIRGVFLGNLVAVRPGGSTTVQLPTASGPAGVMEVAAFSETSTTDPFFGLTRGAITMSTFVGDTFVWGCGAIPAGLFGPQSCGTELVYSFELHGEWALRKESEVGFTGRYADGTAVTCRLGENCEVSVTPEPATLLLLATGLLGIGAAVRGRALG